MGVLLDTSVPIKSTRLGQSETAMLRQVYGIVGVTELGPSTIMIGVSALALNFSTLTANVRHFIMIPGLHVIPF